MSSFLMLCKSYRRDVRRVLRLLQSLEKNNPQQLHIVVAVPSDDVAIFRTALSAHRVDLVTDEDIVQSHPQAAARDLLTRYRAAPGYRSQQVVKSEAWRLLKCDSYLCMDSDTVFLRPVSRDDFVTPQGHPLTLLHQSRELRQLAANRHHDEVPRYFVEESARLKSFFGRTGPDYDFGPTPTLWSARVWSDLHERILEPRGWTFWDAIDHAPTEMRWYGEALLALRSIPVDPIEPLFRVYHYDWQWLAMKRLGETPERVAEQYLGAVYQSNWEYELDALGTRSAASRLGRRLKRWRSRWRL